MNKQPNVLLESRLRRAKTIFVSILDCCKDISCEIDLGKGFHLWHELMIQKEVLYHGVCLNFWSIPLAEWLLPTHFIYEEYVTNKAQIRNDLSIL